MMLRKMPFFFLLIIVLLLPAVPVNAEKNGKVYSDTSGINSWWTYPLSIDNDTYTYTSYNTSSHAGIQQYNRKTGEVKRVNLLDVASDDHNAGAVEFLDDGRILYATAGGHCRYRYIQIFISKRADNIKKWKKIKLSTKGGMTYAQLLKTDSGYYLFSRGRISIGTTGRRYYWSVFYSPDGYSWSDEMLLVNAGTTQYYLKATLCTDSHKIRLVMYSNPKVKKDSDFRLVYLDMDTLSVTDASGKQLYTLSTKGNGFSFKKASVIVEREKGKKQRLLDVASTGTSETVLAYAVFKNSQNAVYRIAVYDSDTGTTKTYDLVDSGSAFYKSSCYFGGMVFSAKTEKILYLSRKIGNYWYIEKWQKKSDGYHRVRVISVSKENQIRPFVSKNKGILQWSRGYYGKNYKNFKTKIIYLNE